MKPQNAPLLTKEAKVNDSVKETAVSSTKLDLDKLYHAVAVAESGHCKTAWHKAAGNCTSIMSWTGGKRHLKKFVSEAQGKAAFKSLWVRAYGNRFPTLKDAVKYTGNDKSSAWLAIVKKTYYN